MSLYETIEEALDLVRHYNGRWIIERFHHALGLKEANPEGLKDTGT